MFKAAIWANKKADNTFTLWASHAPDYEIPSNLDDGMLRLISYGGLSSIEPGTGTFLCSIKDVSREFQLGVMFLDGYISWSVDNIDELFETEFPELVKFENGESDFNQWLAENYEEAGTDASNGEQWYLSKKPTDFMQFPLSKLREQYYLDNEVTDIKEYHLVVTKTQTSETIYHRDITEEAPLDLSTFDLENYLNEVEQQLGFKLSPELPYPGDGDVRVTIGFSPTPFNDVMLWSSRDFYIEN